MKKLKRELMNKIANFEIDVSLTSFNDSKANMCKKDFLKYKKKYNSALEKTANSIIALFWNALENSEERLSVEEIKKSFDKELVKALHEAQRKKGENNV